MHGVSCSGELAAVTGLVTWLSHREQTSISSAAGRACPADVVELRQLARSFSISCCMLHHDRDGGCGNGGPTCDSCCLEVELSYARTLRSTRDCGRRVLRQARRVALRSIGERAARPNDIRGRRNGDTSFRSTKKRPVVRHFHSLAPGLILSVRSRTLHRQRSDGSPLHAYQLGVRGAIRVHSRKPLRTYLFAIIQL